MGLDSIVTKLVVSVIKSTSKLDLVLNNLSNQLKDKCPNTETIKNIYNQKLSIQRALQTAQSTISSLQSTSNTADNIVSTLSTTVSVIKAIPAPTSIPPGVGIPINVITILADSLDTISDILKKNKALISQIPKIFNIMNSNIQNINNKLSILDSLLLKCINESSSEEQRKLLDESQININDLLPKTPPTSSLNNISSTQSLNNNITIDDLKNLIYKGYRFELQDNPNNKFSFPSRRVIGISINDPNKKIISTLTKDGWSYSPSLDILVKEIKTEIDKITS